MASESPTILIVGSGPSGLILALSLLRNGVSARVIEKSMENRLGQRGSGITPRSQELFEALGVIDEVRKRAVGFPMFRMYKMPEGVEAAKEFVGVQKAQETPATPYINFISLGQDGLDKILRAELHKAGCEVELGVELQSLEQLEDHVNVTLLRRSPNANKTEDGSEIEKASYAWVIGADGAKSVVRRQLGLSLLGETGSESFITGDMQVEGLSADRWHLWGGMGDIMTSLRPTEHEGVFNYIIGGTKLEGIQDICASDENFIKFIKEHTGGREDLKYGKVLYLSPYTVNVRMAEIFKKGRVFLTGDAGHIHTPSGGQGMNTGIQDSFNLGWKLALVAKGLSSPSLLDSYNEERIPVISEMLNITNALYQKTLKEPNSEAGWERSGSIRQLGVNYRWSSIVVDEEREITPDEDNTRGSSYDIELGGIVQAGDRAPDAPGLVRIQSVDASPTSLFKLFSPRRHTVVLFADRIDTQSVLPALETYSEDLVRLVIIVKAGEGGDAIEPGRQADVYEDRDGHARDAYRGPQETSGVFVIRPDRVVGGRVGSARALTRYFQNIFG